ncbi:MAG: 6-phosphogluconolactonase [Burkholderiales bacterium]|nr:6-phosphogluconolactonase [Burkholderiales bacterium]
MNAIQFNEYDSRVDLDICLAREIARALEDAIAARGAASLAVSGGRTPVGMFEQLRQMQLPWNKVSITLADDRWLPLDHADSNERLVREHLLKYQVEAATFYSLTTADPTPELGQAAVDGRLRAMPQPFDVIVLGMGEDGHTASLFPCAKELAAATDLDDPAMVRAVNPTTAPYARISLTLRTLVQARTVLLHLAGGNKRTVYQQALAGGTLPIARVLNGATGTRRVYWAP